MWSPICDIIDLDKWVKEHKRESYFIRRSTPIHAFRVRKSIFIGTNIVL